jgi:hypothetical protein
VAFAINRDQRQEGNVAQEQLILSIRHLGIWFFGIDYFQKEEFNIRLGYNVRRAEELRILDNELLLVWALDFSIKLNTQRVRLYLLEIQLGQPLLVFWSKYQPQCMVYYVTSDGFSSTGKVLVAKQLADYIDYLCRYRGNV